MPPGMVDGMQTASKQQVLPCLRMPLSCITKKWAAHICDCQPCWSALEYRSSAHYQQQVCACQGICLNSYGQALRQAICGLTEADQACKSSQSGIHGISVYLERKWPEHVLMWQGTRALHAWAGQGRTATATWHTWCLQWRAGDSPGPLSMYSGPLTRLGEPLQA